MKRYATFRLVGPLVVCAFVLQALTLSGCGSNSQTSPPTGGPSMGPYAHKIYSASSKNGLDWTLDSRMLIDHASVPAAIVTPQGKLRIYYVDASKVPNQIPEGVNCAESSDGGKTFKVLGLTIKNRSGDKAVDPSIVLLPDGRYRLYYYSMTGRPVQPGENYQPEEHSIYSAVSDDGVHFVQEKEVFKYQGLVDPDVFWTGREWLMYVFCSKDAGTIIARSPDGLNFEYVGPSPLKDWGTVAPVRLDDGRFRLYAFDQRGTQGIASFISTDGLQWTREPGTRLTSPEDKRITDPFVVRLPDGTWKMIFKVEVKNERTPAPGPPPPPAP